MTSPAEERCAEQNLDCSLLGQHLVHKPMLDVDSPGISAGQIADQLFVWRRVLERVFFDDGQELLGFGLQATGGEFLRVLSRVLGVNDRPAHQSSSLEQASMGSAMPSLMDSRMPGVESRYSVS